MQLKITKTDVNMSLRRLDKPARCAGSESGGALGSAAFASCAGCGKPYIDFHLDIHVPRSQWLDIAPGPDDAGLLCAQCIVDRASKLPGVTVAHMIFEVSVPPPNGADERPAPAGEN